MKFAFLVGLFFIPIKKSVEDFGFLEGITRFLLFNNRSVNAYNIHSASRVDVNKCFVRKTVGDKQKHYVSLQSNVRVF
jgi:hypothetical protein